MRKLFILLTAALLFVACAHNDSSFSKEAEPSIFAKHVFIGNLYYNLYDNKTAEVAKDGSYKNSLSGVLSIPSTIEYNSDKYTVTSIEKFALSGCAGLTSITLPNSVTRIVYAAFSDCTGLQNPVYNEHIFAYMPPSYKGAYAIPNGITQIADEAFSFCTGLTSVTIPNSVTSIGDGAFEGCTNLQIFYEE